MSSGLATSTLIYELFTAPPCPLFPFQARLSLYGSGWNSCGTLQAAGMEGLQPSPGRQAPLQEIPPQLILQPSPEVLRPSSFSPGE